MKVLRIAFLTLLLTAYGFSQSATLKGTVSDLSGAAIDKVQMTVIDTENEKFFRTSTDDYGDFSLNISSGKYTIEFSGRNGFLTTIVIGFDSEANKIYDFDINLEVDLECPTCVFSEFVCEQKKKNAEEYDCVYVSRLGKGGSKPKIIKFSDLKPKNNKEEN